ncbi:uncharacterized protein EAE98_010646 [Botrytis deweyae]|uniref:Up-regulated during septation protein 1 domain-containing protein n=1 Tax=Botrytis deweyae TaxID=2478750 RepID=A0ABQ7I8B1_9HELO|nr:uncharacterized protein EAE98_010646 [Botrytis deweyae]KAF7916637.1 hypothetical protein EAE98_010646 [Botrytis deweyae]
MSSRKHSEDRPPLRGPTGSHRDDRHRPAKNYGSRDGQVNEEGHENRRLDGGRENKDSGTKRNGERADRGSRSSEENSSMNTQLPKSDNRSPTTTRPTTATTDIEPASKGTNHRGEGYSNLTANSMPSRPSNIMEKSVNPLINASKQVPVTESSQLESLIDALMQFANQGDSRSMLNQVRNSAEESLKQQVEEIQRMSPIMQSFPTHMDVQNKRKAEAEDVLTKTNEELEKAKRLQKEAAKNIASCLVIKASPPIADDSRYLQERCRKLEEKVKDLEKTMTAMDQKDKISDINVRFQESQVENRKVVAEIKRSEAQFAEMIETSEAKTKREHQNLSDQFTKLDQRHQATRSELASLGPRIDSRLDSHENSLKKHDASINNSEEKMTTLQQETGKQSTILKAKSDDIELLTSKVTSLEKSSENHRVSLNDFKSSSLEKISELKNDMTKFIELQTAQRDVAVKLGTHEQELNAMKNTHKVILQSLGTTVEELNSLKDKIGRLEQIPQPPSIAISQAPSKIASGSSATMIGVMQTRIRNALEDIRVLEERIDKIESSLGSPSRTMPQEDAKVHEQLKSTMENYESRLNELEDSLKKIDPLSMNKPVTRISPFSTAAQDITDVKKAFELYKEQREQMDQVLFKRVEELDNQVNSIQRSDITINEKIANIQIRMDVFVQDLNRFAHRVTETNNDQNANTIALRHLNSRFNNISTDDLAKNMLHQLEVIYPDVGNAERNFLELRKQHSSHTTQLEKLKSQVVALQGQSVRKQSPTNAGNGATESLRQEVDLLTKGQIKLGTTAKKLDEATTSTQAGLTTLKQSYTTLDLKIQDLNGKIETQQKSLTEMSADLIEAVGDLQAGLEYLQKSSSNDTTEPAGDTPAPAQSTLHRAQQSSAQEAVINGKKRKDVTGVEPSKLESLTNGHTRSPLRKKAKRAEDGEDLEQMNQRLNTK